MWPKMKTQALLLTANAWFQLLGQVGASENNFGSSQKTFPVKTDIVIMPSLPRRIATGDTFSIPLNVFNLACLLSPWDNGRLR